MPFYAMMATGLVVLHDGASPASVGGTCAAYVQRHILITASHCVPEGPDVYVQMPGETQMREIERVARHPDADLALLMAQPLENEQLGDQVYLGVYDGLVDGGDFIGYGYPVEGSEDGAPVGRLFKGHFQRYFGYTPPDTGKPYFAGEMSIPAPAGFSGGPLAYSVASQQLVAVVTTNHDSWAVIDRLEEVERDGVVYREEVRRVVSYGIAAMLSGLQPWLAEQNGTAD